MVRVTPKTIKGPAPAPWMARKRGDYAQPPIVLAARRLFSNVIACLVLLLSLVTLAVLISQGMFARSVVSFNEQSMRQFWTPYGKSCLLDKYGFVPNRLAYTFGNPNATQHFSCSFELQNTTQGNTWSALGLIMAKQWTAELAKARTLFLTTCVIGASSSVGWGDLQFIAGYDGFPECLPTSGAQQVAGMAMLETTMRDSHPEGLYFLTMYSDLNPAMQTVQTYTNTDGTTAHLMANPSRTLVTLQGQAIHDNLGQDYTIYSYPLGPRYQVTESCQTQIEALAAFTATMAGWSQGKYSQHPIVPGWTCGHVVQNADELIVLQIVVFLAACVLLIRVTIFMKISDFTDIGLLMAREPTLTYRLLDGLERRKCLTLLMTLNALPSLLYLDVARIYYFTENGFKLWCLSVALVAVLFSFAFVFVLSCSDIIPVPQILHNVCGCYNATFFLYSAALTIVFACAGTDTSFRSAYNDFFAATPSLGLWLRGQTWPSGAYIAQGTPTVISRLTWQLCISVATAFATSLVVTALYRLCNGKRCVENASSIVLHAASSLLMATNWCSRNGFVSFVNPPTLLSSLPLDEAETSCVDLILSESYAKAMSRTRGEPSKPGSDDSLLFVVSIYAVIPAVYFTGLCWFPPRIFGRIVNGEFTATPDLYVNRTLRYRYEQGTLVH
ncbi:hypothetical protein ACHHYP_16644 [Achlya hypogyna]|uniref:Transmembrane protein n=1 Tax=Achlya hypogyna TaxID=1202772 RepID=A0A1V9Y656_ACHHY|nr:hypothetical protein ACHHYP_16644 [Achlya hypogyna]